MNIIRIGQKNTWSERQLRNCGRGSAARALGLQKSMAVSWACCTAGRLGRGRRPRHDESSMVRTSARFAGEWRCAAASAGDIYLAHRVKSERTWRVRRAPPLGRCAAAAAATCLPGSRASCAPNTCPRRMDHSPKTRRLRRRGHVARREPL